jgi:SAM-dependent methyltransferase
VRGAHTEESVRSEYWDAFYAAAGAPAEPSRFAVFTQDRYPGLANLIDIGCGNGRDALHFARAGLVVRGIDASTQAIESVRRRAADEQLTGRTAFFAGLVESSAVWAEAEAGLEGPVLLYARFLFHAINEASEAGLLKQAAGLLSRKGGALCAEFRTTGDALLAKAEPAHFRRYIDPDVFCSRLEALGLTIEYRIEATGLAIHKGEDALVARVCAVP